MTVSHKPDHGLQAKLHEDTAYGTISNPAKEGGNLVYRKPFLLLNEKEIGRIRDRRLRSLVEAHVATERAAGKDLKAALQSFAAANRHSGPSARHSPRSSDEDGEARLSRHA